MTEEERATAVTLEVANLVDAFSDACQGKDMGAVIYALSYATTRYAGALAGRDRIVAVRMIELGTKHGLSDSAEESAVSRSRMN
jgi:hypothetical protein